MREFFHGWRRKMGVMTLLVACLLMAGWVRSEFASDIFMYDLNVNDDQWGGVKSYRQRLSWSHIFGDPDNIKESAGFQYLSYPATKKDLESSNQSIDLSRIEWLGFEFRVQGIYGSVYPPYEVSVAVPYWSLVLPLTLLSAYLLLNKPRPKQKQSVTRA